MIVGNILYVRNIMPISQVNSSLCDTLDLGQAKPRQIPENQPFLDEVTNSSTVSTYNYSRGTSSTGSPLEFTSAFTPSLYPG